MKAPSKRTATSSKTPSSAVEGRTSRSKSSAVAVKAASKPAAKTTGAAARSAPTKATAPAVAKKTAGSKAAGSKSGATASAKAPAASAKLAKAPVKTPAKTATKAPAKAAKAATKPAPVAAAKTPAAPRAPVAKGARTAVASAAPAATKPAVRASATAKPAVKAAAPVKAPAAKPAVAAPLPVPSPPPAAPPVVEPTPRPLGKRAAKKVMMEQMTQAAVVPTHAPDAAKATFFTMNERVMTPPAPSAVQKDPKRANNWKTVPADQLTDQDILAMPDSEYMNDVQLAFFRRKLTQLKADMLANAGETTEHLREDTVVVPDPADRATIEEEHALELRTRDRERKLLKKIEQAIARIDSGDYGYCDETGEPIGVGRLMARPTASLSLEAQQRRELKQKMFGD